MEQNNICVSDTDDRVMLKILSSIGNRLFHDERYKDILWGRYEEMMKQCNWDFPYGPTDNGCAVKYVSAPEAYKDYNVLGFDLPTLIRLDNQGPIKNIIMIVSQDPKRTERYQGMLSLSSSFGFHDKSYRENNRKGFMTSIVREVLTDNPSLALYFTDCHKLNTSDERGILKTDSDKYGDILKEEIDLLKPCHIIAHGRAAGSFLKKIKDRDYSFVPYLGNHYMSKEGKEQAKIDFKQAVKTNTKK